MTNASVSTLRVLVSKKIMEAEAIASFKLVENELVDGLPPFTAGAHIDVHLPNGLIRQYSLCGSPLNRDSYTICVLREPAGRGGSSAMHDSVFEGDSLVISAPKNHFPLRENVSHSLLLAGGIGVTPLLAMAEQLHVESASFELHYCTRSLARTAFATSLKDSAFAEHVYFYRDDGSSPVKMDIGICLGSPAIGKHLYVCGPPAFLDIVRSTARDNGWNNDNVHFEYFSGAVTDKANDRSFDVVLKKDGRVIRVSAEQTVVEALAENGVVIPTSCSQGVCGTCITTVVEGEIDHHDLYLTPEEQRAGDKFLPCCSRAVGKRIVIDI
jgi:vanillate O-demethylase ferredoxin subunit